MPNPTHPFLKLRHLAALALLAACSGDATGPAAENEEEGEVLREPRFDLTATVRYIEVTSEEACDEVNFVTGEPRDGEFQYRVEVSSSAGGFGAHESDGFGSVLGHAFSRFPGELINFANREHQFSQLKVGDKLTVAYFGSEWDGPTRDPRMDERRTAAVFTITSSLEDGIYRDRRIPTGEGAECELTLVWDLTVRRTMVVGP